MHKRKSKKPLGLRGVIVMLVITMFNIIMFPAVTMAETIEKGGSESEVTAFEMLEAAEIQAPVVEEVQLDANGGESEQILDDMGEKNGVVLFAAAASDVNNGEMAVPADETDNVVLNYNKIIRHESWFTRNFTVTYDGKTKVAYCIEPKDYPPEKGNHTAVKYDNELMTKALYYSYGYPGYEKHTRAYLDKCNLPVDYRGDDGAYVISHLILSYFYDNKSNSSDAFKGLSTSTKTLIQNMAADMEKNWPDVPEDASLAFDVTHVSAQWNRDKQVQETPTITLQGHTDNKISVTVPSGVTMVKLSGDELTEYTADTENDDDSDSLAASNRVVDVYGGDEFYFTAPASVKGHFESGQMTGSLQDFQPYLIKVSNKQDILYCGERARDTVSFSIDWNDMGNFILNKVSASPEITDKNKNYSLEGAEYEIYDGDGAVYEKLVTDAEGAAQVLLPYGEYVLREKTAPQGYAVDPEEISITVNSDENVMEHEEQIITDKSENDESPKTGDETAGNIALWVIAIISAGVVAASVGIGTRKL